jgi:uncharacterized membrane protein YhaH (DUF805 family)
MTYHIKIDYQPEIEINSEDLIRRIKSKEIPSHAMLKSAKEGEWRPLESYPEFSHLTPPPLPNQQINQIKGSETLLSIQNKSQIPNYFLPSGRIGRLTWLLRNTVNLFAIWIALACINILPNVFHIYTILALLLLILYLYILLITSIKRLHDLNVTGWIVPIIFIPLVPLFLLILSGAKSENRFGKEKEGLFY